MLGWLGKTLNEQFWKAKQSQSRVSAMVDALPGALAWMNAEQNILGLNKKLGELIHQDHNTLINKNIPDIDNADFLHVLSKELFESGASFESQIIPIEGRTFFFVAQKYHHNSEAVVLGIDITEQKIWESEVYKLRNQAVQSSKYTNVGEMMTGFIDDIQQPMGEIIGLFPQLKLDLKGLGENSMALREIESRTHVLNRTIKALNCFTMNSQEMDYQPYKLQDLIEHLRALLEDHCKNHNLSIYMNDVSESLMINCKPNEILQVFFTIVENALEANDNGKEDWVKVGIYETQNNEIKITITDSGPGVEEFMEDIIFEPSYTTKEEQGGTGVGLSVSKELIENHSGKLFYNQDSAFSQFVIILPQLEVAQAA